MSDKPLDPYDPGALEKSLNDSATRVSAIWVGLLLFGLYLAVTAGTITHRQLLLQAPVKLPVLEAALPLVGFFFLAPILFVILHVYVLLQVLLLSRTAATYSEALDRKTRAPPGNAAMRQRLANTLFAQIFAGAPRERAGPLGWLLRAMAWLTLAIAPLLVLLVFQLVFLPCHNHLVTWTHRLLVLLDLAVVALLWPLALHPERDFAWRRLLAIRFVLAAVAVAGVVSLVVLSFPGESHVARLGGRPPGSVDCARTVRLGIVPDGPVQWLQSAWSRLDRLHLARIDIVDDTALKRLDDLTSAVGERAFEGERTHLLRGRNLDCADLSNFADLRRVDLTGASLRGALLVRAKLQGASLAGASLEGATLTEARLQGASLVDATLTGATLDYAQLRGATLARARLVGASLFGADIQGASLEAARLQGARLDATRLQGSLLDHAQLQGASLEVAMLQGASLRATKLQGAFLADAQLQGASLVAADLRGATLDDAQLQGADLAGARLDDADLPRVFVWRTKTVTCSGARVQAPRLDRIIVSGRIEWPRPHTLLPTNSSTVSAHLYGSASSGASAPAVEPNGTIARFVDDALAEVLDADLKRAAMTRLRDGLLDDRDSADTNAAEAWRACEAAATRLPRSEFERRRAAFLRSLACDAEDGRAAIAKLMATRYVKKVGWHFGRSESDRPNVNLAARIARGLLGEDGKPCGATRDLDAPTRRTLRALAAAAEREIAEREMAKREGATVDPASGLAPKGSLLWRRRPSEPAPVSPLDDPEPPR